MRRAVPCAPRCAGALLAAVLLLVFLAGAASAHAVFVSASPAPDARLSHSPSTVRIVFSEPLVPALSSIEVDSSAGVPVRERRGRLDPANHSAYEVRLPHLRPDRYTVVWHTTSQIDGHSRWGSYSFTVLEPGGGLPHVSPAAVGLPSGPHELPTWVQAVTSWVGLAALFAVVGAVLLGILGRGHEPLRRAFARLLRLAGLGTLVGVAGQFAATWAGAGFQASVAPSVLDAGAARWWWLRMAGVIVVLLAWTEHGRRLPRSVWRVVLVAGAMAMVVSYGASGHGAASPVPAAGLAFTTIHVLAASVWLGGVLALAAVWSLARRTGTTRAELTTLLRRFSVAAGLAVPAVAATGAASALLELGSFDDFVRTTYGVALLVKIAVVAMLGAAAASTVWMHTRHPADAVARRFRSHLWLEAGLGLAVLVPTATLSVLGPSRPVDAARATAQRLQAAPGSAAAAFAASGHLGPRDLELTLTPGTTGPNALEVEVDGRFSPSRLGVQLTGPRGSSVSTLQRTGYDHDPKTHTIYRGTTNLTGLGSWQAVVSGAGTSSLPLLVPVRPDAPARPGSGSARLDGWLLVIALLGAAGVAVGAGRSVRRRGPRRASLAFGATVGLAGLATGVVLSHSTAPAAAATVPTSWGVAHRVAPNIGTGARTWPIGAADTDLMMPAVGPDGSVWVGEMATNRLARLDPADGVLQQVRLPGGYKEIMGVAVDDDDHVWVAEEHAQALGMFDPATGHYRQYQVPGHDPAPLGIVVDARGMVWFTAMSGNWVGRFDPATARFTEYPIPTPRAMPYGLAVAPDGAVWFTEFGAGRLGVLRPGSDHISEIRLPAGSSPADVAVDDSGTVWATTTEGLLVRLRHGARPLRIVRAPVADEYGVTTTPDGTVWVGTASGRAVYSFDARTGDFQRHPLPGGSRPWWLVADRGQVWAALAGPAQGRLGEIGGSGP
ncbi:MAG TPA: copper resistance protein CopC [Nocardioidaceae bacterium]|nr:copper resistance protein CopC [Nocardioidaceae bacterium]